MNLYREGPNIFSNNVVVSVLVSSLIIIGPFAISCCATGLVSCDFRAPAGALLISGNPKRTDFLRNP